MRPFDPLRVLEHVHGHIGWLAALALVHPAILLRRRRRLVHWSVGLGTALVTVTGGLGAILYPAYRSIVRTELFASAPTLGWLFERKEHLGLGALFFAWAGALAYGGATWVQGEPRDALRRAAHWAFVASATFAVAAAALGTVVAAYKTF